MDEKELQSLKLKEYEEKTLRKNPTKRIIE
jgi:hypothetical protein